MNAVACISSVDCLLACFPRRQALLLIFLQTQTVIASHSRHPRCSLPTLIMKVNKFRHSKPPTGRIGQIFHNIRPWCQRNSRHSFQHQTKFQVYFRWRPYAAAATAKHKSHQDRPASGKKRKREKRNTMQIQQKKATHLHLSTYTLQSQTLR